MLSALPVSRSCLWARISRMLAQRCLFWLPSGWMNIWLPSFANEELRTSITGSFLLFILSSAPSPASHFYLSNFLRHPTISRVLICSDRPPDDLVLLFTVSGLRFESIQLSSIESFGFDSIRLKSQFRPKPCHVWCLNSFSGLFRSSEANLAK